MIKYFQRAFKITSENIILATPLILFLFLFNLYLSLAKGVSSNIFSSLLLISTVFFMLSAFFAGWFYMIKSSILLEKLALSLEEDEKAKASFNLIREIPSGVGEYFFSFLGASIIYLIIFSAMAIISFKIGMHYIGALNIDLAQLKLAMTSSVAMKSLITSMSAEELIRLNKWNLLILFSTMALSFLTMLWPAQIVYKDKNPFVALFKSIKIIFSHPLETVILFIYISFINFLTSLVNTLSMANQILYFVSLLAYFYFIVYIVVLIFLYYDSKNEEKSYSDSGTDSLG